MREPEHHSLTLALQLRLARLAAGFLLHQLVSRARQLLPHALLHATQRGLVPIDRLQQRRLQLGVDVERAALRQQLRHRCGQIEILIAQVMVGLTQPLALGLGTRHLVARLTHLGAHLPINVRVMGGHPLAGLRARALMSVPQTTQLIADLGQLRLLRLQRLLEGGRVQCGACRK